MPLLRRATASLGKTHARYASSKATVTIGLRQEDPERVWERRSPLTPAAVEELVSREGVRVLVQECDKRVFPLDDYVHVWTLVSQSHVSELIILYRRVLKYIRLPNRRISSWVSRRRH